MPYADEKAPNPGLVRDDPPEDAIPKLDKHTVEVLQAEEDAHLGVKAVEAAEKVYGRYSKWFLFVGYASFLSTNSSRTAPLTLPRFVIIESAWRPTSIHLTAPPHTTISPLPPLPSTSIVSSPQFRSLSPSSVSLPSFSLFLPPSRLTSRPPVACGKPVIAKFAAVTSRATAYLIVRTCRQIPRYMHATQLTVQLRA